jgi:hypothetical protein
MKRFLAIALGTALAFPASAAVLYKSVDPNGTIVFSDLPPAEGARLLDHRVIGGNGPSSLTPLEEAYTRIDADADLARANTRLDLAEHALALARRNVWSHRDGLRLDANRMASSDEERVAFYRRNVLEARKTLLDKLRERRLAAK